MPEDTKTTKTETVHEVQKPSIWKNKPFLVMFIIATVLLASVIVSAGMMMLRTGINSLSANPSANNTSRTPRGNTGTGLNGQGGLDGRMGQNGQSDGTRLSGVVISVGTNSFIVAGNGKQVMVNITDTTTFSTTAKTVAVNDSVLVTGATTDNTMTATQIRIENR